MSSPVQPPLTVTTVGGTPSGRPITTIKVSNGDLTISGNTATIDTSGSGGGGSVTSITFSSPLTGGTITTSGTVGIPEADGSTDGYLSSTAYNTFDGKQDAITLTTTGSSGVATFTAGTLNIPNYTNTATIGGSIANTQVAYGSGANTIQGSANLTFDGTNLDVAGYVKSGTGVYDTNGATDLTLQTNGGTATGKIVIFDGAGQDIEITPEGAGVINLDGLKWPSADGSANQVLQTDGAGTLSFTDASGGVTFPLEGTDGSASAPTYSFSSDTDTGFYRSGSGSVSLSLNNTRMYDFATTNFKIRGNNPVIKCDVASAPLELRSGGGTYGEVNIGVENSNIEIKPAGTGLVKINDAFTLPGAVTTTNDYVLTAQTDGTTAWAAAGGGGGGSPGGSDTQLQYNDGGSFGGASAITYTDTAGSEQLLIDDTSDQPLVKIVQQGTGAAFEVHDQATDTSIFAVDPSGAVLVGYASGTGTVLKFLVSGSAGADYFLAATDGNAGTPVFSRTNESDTGLFFPTDNNTLAVTTGATERFRFGASGELLISGTDAGTSGQVFTSGGASASPTWEDAGGGSGFLQPAIATGAFLSSANKYPCFTSAPYGSSQIITTDTSADYDTNPCMRPFVLAEGGTWGGVAINVQTASSSNAILISLYNSNSDGMPTSFVGYCEVATTSTGNITQTTTLDSSGSSATITLAKDTQYWCSFVSKASSDSYTLMSVAADSLAGFGGSNMQNEYTLLRNTFVSNDIETTNPPRNTQTLSDRDAPHIGIII